MTNTKPVRIRIAPSPTGDVHVGTGRTALYDYLFVKQTGGTFIMRIDDTDLARNTAHAEAGVYHGLHWLGLDWTEGPDKGGPHAPYRQSERLALYQQYAEQLLTAGHAYYCYCTAEELEALRALQTAAKEDPRYSGKCRDLSASAREALSASGRIPTIRLKVKGKVIGFDDLVRGWIETDTSLMGDFIIMKSNGIPVYNYATVIDDNLMEITHVTRAAEHIVNTFPQLLIYAALGWPTPFFAHFSTMLNEDKSKLSKRKGATFIGQYAEMGYLPEAMVNFLAFLGWSPGDSDEEMYTLDELVEKFSFARCTASNAIFDIKKFDWLNAKWIRKLAPEDLAKRILPFLRKAGLADADVDINWLTRMTTLIQERMVRLDEAPAVAAVFFQEPAAVPEEVRAVLGSVDGGAMLSAVASVLSKVNWTEADIEGALRSLQGELGLSTKVYFMTLRLAVTGSKVSPPLFASIEVIGRERVLRRIENLGVSLGDTGVRHPDPQQPVPGSV
ncbi:MAG: Glutamate--tRNA ligase 1 [Firmicutes bacterium]|nr:Glutamate--tRNA ligase 1 [candidate division NPL-UPA2 bacterium]